MNAWHRELLTGLLFLLISILAGLIYGLFFPAAFFFTLLFLFKQILLINQLQNWLRVGGLKQYPECKGIWEDIYYYLHQIKKSEKRRKKKLSKLLEQFQKSTEALPDAAVVLGVNDEIQWTNSAARQVLGLKHSDKGQRLPNLIRFPEFVSFVKSRNYNQTILIHSPVNDDITLQIRIVTYGAGLRLLLAHDVSQLKKMERTRKDFVANVSHELRTPLTVLKGYLETLKDLDFENSALYTQSLDQMQIQTNRMEQLVDDLLLLTRLETQPQKNRCVNVPALLSQICREVDTLKHAASRIELNLESSAGVHGDEQELRSAFTNLIINALKYSPDDSLVKLRWYQLADNSCFEVIDQGEGISLANISRVTERFFRVDRKRTKKVIGTGLGLAIVKHVCQRHEAELKIVSELGKGSCFSCIFPKQRRCPESNQV